MENGIKNTEYEKLIDNVGELLNAAKNRIVLAVNSNIVQTYWQIGNYIVEYEQKGNERAEYGSDLLNRLSKDLTLRYGSGFSRSNVFYIRKLYMEYPKVQTLSELSWSHYIELLKIEDSTERSFYEKESINSHWGVRELKRQMKFLKEKWIRKMKMKDSGVEWIGKIPEGWEVHRNKTLVGDKSSKTQLLSLKVRLWESNYGK